MHRTFDLAILSPGKTVYKGKAVSMVAPAGNGYIGIWRDHAPLIAPLGKGAITIKEEGVGTVSIASPGGGILEIQRKKVTILFKD
ncbi:MAG: F0F1 ATP synthase subunit epsilon [Candidatus Omnitrophica bacterium]|nr:F0F1 ATP synthase subunit epsilon [Candidatus Omnitrophota bacterium]